MINAYVELELKQYVVIKWSKISLIVSSEVKELNLLCF